MSDKASSSSSGGIGFGGALTVLFGGALTVLFVGLKLTHYIDWSWWWVFSPLWIIAALVVVIMAVVVAIALAVGK